MSTLNILAVPDLVWNKIEDTVNAGPALNEEVSDDDRTLSENWWNKKSGEEEDHESCEDQQHPCDVKLT